MAGISSIIEFCRVFYCILGKIEIIIIFSIVGRISLEIEFGQQTEDDLIK